MEPNVSAAGLSRVSSHTTLDATPYSAVPDLGMASEDEEIPDPETPKLKYTRRREPFSNPAMELQRLRVRLNASAPRSERVVVFCVLFYAVLVFVFAILFIYARLEFGGASRLMLYEAFRAGESAPIMP